MSFRERSAWVMATLLTLMGIYYLKLVIGDGVAPAFAAIPFILMITVLSVAAQIMLAVIAPREAGHPADERERVILDRAARFSSYVLAVGVICGLGLFMATQDGMKMFHVILTCLILGQIAEYVVQIRLFRSQV